MRPTTRLLLKVTGSLVCLAITLLIIGALNPLPYGSLATVDFIQYWRSWRLMREGLNPYDPILAATTQNSLTQTQLPVVLSWNPPWTFTLLSPILFLPFGQAAAIWMAIQCLLLGVIAVVTPVALEARRVGVVASALTTVVFLPTLNSIYWGQLGILLATSVALFLFFQQRDALFLAGLSLIPLSVKPHLLFLFAIPGFIWLLHLPRRKSAMFVSGFGIGALVLLTSTLLVAPSSMTNWLVAMSSDPSTLPSDAVPFQRWQTTTLTSWIRILLANDHAPTWPLQAVPLTAFLITGLYFFRSKEPIVWKDLTPILLPITLITNSYGWLYDQSLLVISQFAVICGALSLKTRTWKVALLATAFLVQLLGILLSNAPQHHYVWLPLTMLALLTIQRRLKAHERT